MLFVCAACARETTAPVQHPEIAVLAGRSPNIPAVSLVVTVSSFDGLGNSYGIQSDGQGAYTDGLQGVQAILDTNGTFAFNTLSSAKIKSALRWVAYDFSRPIDPANTYRPTPSNSENYHFSTGASQFSPFIPIQNLGVNGNPNSECGYMGNSLANSTTQWRVSFHKGFEDVDASPAAFAVFTRTSVSPAVWTVTPSGACSPNSNVASLRSGDGTVLYGYYYLPFQFTLRAK
jgi:hypothetical protein